MSFLRIKKQKTKKRCVVGRIIHKTETEQRHVSSRAAMMLVGSLACEKLAASAGNHVGQDQYRRQDRPSRSAVCSSDRRIADLAPVRAARKRLERVRAIPPPRIIDHLYDNRMPELVATLSRETI